MRMTFNQGRTALLAASLAFVLAACSGSGSQGPAGADGTNGAPGAAGTDGAPGSAGPAGPAGSIGVATVESCSGCHDTGLPATHVRRNQVAISGVAVGNATNNLTVTFNVKVDGVNANDFTHLDRAYIWTYDTTAEYGTRTQVDVTANPVAVVSNYNGNYTATLSGFGPSGANAVMAPFGTTSLMLRLDNGNSQPQATVVANYTSTGAMAGLTVSNQACINCHGDRVFSAVDAYGVPTGHHGANPIGVEACMICHNRGTDSETRLGTSTAAPGTRLMGYVHGIHSSKNMPAATNTTGGAIAGGVYYRNGGASSTFSIGFPGYMNNCSTCHTAASLTTIKALPLSWKNCMSCHVGPPTTVGPTGATQTVAAGFAWGGFGRANTGTAATPVFLFGGWNHANYTVTTAQSTCDFCHDGSQAPNTLAQVHNGQKTERNGLIWDGSDVSVDEGAKFVLAVTGVTRSGSNYLVTWTARYNGSAIDPCNTDFAVGPVFLGVVADTATGKSASNMQFIKAYGQGDDWVNAGRTGSVSPGQPATSVTLTSSNTTCASNVATTTTPVDTFVAAGTKGTMALQGKPQLSFAPAAGSPGAFIQARAKSPTYNFVVPSADGAATAGAARRAIVDTDKCLDCHKGTLYQHGGNRVDNNDLCVTCHNPAANETNNRVFFGVTAATAYDGKPGEAYDMRNMIHAIHSAGETGRSYVIYRTRGIYFFGNPASFADAVATKHWPTTGGVTCIGGEGAPVTYYPVYGSVPGATEKVPVVGTGGVCDTTTGPAATAAWQIHNVLLVEYPRPLSDCNACHSSNWVPAAVDGSKGVAMTVDAGSSVAWGNQLDDVLMGPTAASCMSCHQSGDATKQFYLRTHAYGGSWLPTTFVNGRQTLLDAVP
jgi:OmcA/MtrC family decaheme c-type cytochrome